MAEILQLSFALEEQEIFATASTGLVLNGTPSSDPEAHPLTLCWYDQQAPNVASPPAPCSAGPYIGNSLTFTYAVGWGTSHDIWLEVRDPALLSDRTATQSINNST